MQSFLPIAVFLGPSLRIDEAKKILDANYYPPVRKGDIYRILPSGVETIILIDGVFHQKRPVWQREICAAINAGIKVYGASGVGALRAAELQAFGMKGCGKIFEWYRDGIIDGDDEIWLTYGDASDNFRPISEPLVNIRYTLLNAVKDGCLATEQAEELVTFAKQLYYPDRSYQQLLKSPVLQQLSPVAFADITTYLMTKQVDLKKLDAIQVLNCQTEVSQKQYIVSSKFNKLELPVPEILSKRVEMTGFIRGDKICTGRELLLAVKQDVNLLKEMQINLSKQCFIREWAQQNSIFYPEKKLESDMADWEKVHGIVCDLKWLQSNGLTLCSYRELIRERLAIDWIANQGPEYFGIKVNLEQSIQEELQITNRNSSCISEAELTALRYELSQRYFILEWAKQNSISPGETLKSYLAKKEQESIFANSLNLNFYRLLLKDIAFEEWIVKQSPNYFGIPWSFPSALCRELQITGKAADLLKNK
ncbi:MAG: hypothetical protein EAZ39_13710 [Oscillatoriales cyanobacterium]|uniref:TfuA-like protein n=1 Tax=unclassified Microcoleus TaxID=2642155 RepID=UPI001DF3BC8C|nr:MULTISPECIES: TfuA-like protein [unclassified Microcoleus]TAG17339.1 MAG: hypothetical protein EAZ39_13710 [Oscillatoriales cyanobacterium]MCC3433968.1 hypothetical protein [Microcoleus sp. PH2017_05_CCC_O_A]MCC3582966.1 hypothetical protein [Microcoleus sp. PH2017_30_WIL_O_A]TAG45494.1 MAG: hypothetical protein EAZ33_07470 [Oscillatoriales cyanobacterium]TAG60479.1 MAG: hypothetical protein EAZ28_07070 [Oscillatoriales cyanobacterium]